MPGPVPDFGHPSGLAALIAIFLVGLLGSGQLSELPAGREAESLRRHRRSADEDEDGPASATP